MEIRKISIGPDYKSGAMHYILNQDVLGGTHTIHLITNNSEGIKVYLINDKEEVLLWKSFTNTIPASIEYNIYF
jgi:hypothetical protein|tara:strand:+ start:1242 stop:1463 length:222 start_codon:yes stop_codon:yes gene_type:complete